MNLTQPLECLQQLSGQPDGGSAWVWDVEKMLMDVKTACANIKFLGAIFKEIRTILEDGHVSIEHNKLFIINQCSPSVPTASTPQHLHASFISILVLKYMYLRSWG